MQGKILNITGKFALIRSENTDKFEVPLSEIKSELFPRIGDNVDFDLVEGKVESVYILRQSAPIDEHLFTAKNTANHIYKKVKSNINEENLDRAKELASMATGKAKANLQAINLSKAKEALKFVEMTPLNGTSGVSVHNKFALFTLTCLFVSMLLPAVNLGIGVSTSYFELIDSITLQVIFMLASFVSLAIGAPRFISKTLCAICLITILIPLYQLFNSISDLANVGREFGVTNKSVIKQIMKSVEFGLPMLVISFSMFFLITLLPRYNTSPKFSASAN
ncbi:hypothetical protein [Shewanella sp. KCT]|uniref:hypothetical protein n=1 Tax=Shewanella sp. KCT TaxID=2569535 RepID=UPI001182D248|nr:hypothetical protein [Shewanella sp. KCT]TVP16343.1 hypothetical protein AYI87_02695 [Shewanella sp. KCT]